MEAHVCHHSHDEAEAVVCEFEEILGSMAEHCLKITTTTITIKTKEKNSNKERNKGKGIYIISMESKTRSNFMFI